MAARWAAALTVWVGGQGSVLAADVVFGCPDPRFLQGHSTASLASRLLVRLAGLPPPGEGGPPADGQEIWEEINVLIADSAGSAKVIMHKRESMEVFTNDASLPTPCLPAIVATELLEVLFVWKVERDLARARVVLRASYDRVAWLRNAAWKDIMSLGWGAIFGAGQEACHLAQSSAATDSEEVFFQYRELYGFDYRDCARRFSCSASSNKSTATAACACLSIRPGCRSRNKRSLGADRSPSVWPHRAFLALVLRQPWLCGASCRFGAAFAHVAQMLATPSRAGRRRPRLSEDDLWLLREAQSEMLATEPRFKQERSDPTEEFCPLLRAFPVWQLLSRVSCIELRTNPLVASVSETSVVNEGIAPPSAFEAMGCSATLEGDRYVSGWPPQQRLSASGALAAYVLISAVGGILDAFGVRWWAAHATLLGALRNGGLLPQECDVDIALWRGDSHWLTRPQVRSALAAAGVAMYYMPLYFVFRFCPVHLPPEAESRSVDGKVSCQPPYVDAHLADVVPFEEDRWDYIHRSDSRYAHAFPLSGLFRWQNFQQGQGFEDLRLRWPFGDHAQIWVPRPDTSVVYLSMLYGSDWKTALRQRDGPIDEQGRRGLGALVHNDSESQGAAFRGIFARPSGPLRDVVTELRSIGA